MLSDVLVSAEGVYKEYISVSRPWLTLLRVFFHSIRVPKNDIHNVLNGIDLTIRRGETVGIIGRNGAGKTTLLGVLGDIIKPTGGQVKRYGKVAALLGTTAGFNVNFTGRENAYLFCAIHAMSTDETVEKIKMIEDFAQLGQYFDMPLRTYSSGMQSRLSFSCAINVNADVMILDETLAVGDADFKAKCYNKINKLKEKGQTFILVSHSQNLITNFCTRAILLESGAVLFDGSPFKAIAEYKRLRTSISENKMYENKINKYSEKNESDSVKLTEFEFVIDESDSKLGIFSFKIISNRNINCCTINFGIRNYQGIDVSSFDGLERGFQINDIKAEMSSKVLIKFDAKLLVGRNYISVLLFELKDENKIPLGLYQDIIVFDALTSAGIGGVVNLNVIPQCYRVEK